MTDNAEKTVRPKSSVVWEDFTLHKVRKCVTCELCKSKLAWYGIIRNRNMLESCMRMKGGQASGGIKKSGKK